MISLDLETTGLDPNRHNIASIGAVETETGDEFYEECYVPEFKEVSEKALEVNGFTREQLHDKSKPSIQKVVGWFVDWATQYIDEETEEVILMGFNINQFDVQFLKKYRQFQEAHKYFGHRYVDLFSWYNFITGRTGGGVSACEHFGVPKEPEPHNALEGAKQNVRLWWVMKRGAGDHGVKDIGNYIITYTRKQFHFESPSEDEVSISDIAHGLSNICRFGGQGDFFLSVAFHSVSVAKLIFHEGGSDEEVLQGLLHDSSEAYLADVPGPAKIYLPSYQKLEQKILKVVGSKYGVDLNNLPDIVEWADHQHLYWEANALYNNPDWTGEIETDFLNSREVKSYSDDGKKGEFLMLFNEYHSE